MKVQRESPDLVTVQATMDEIRIIKDCLLNLDNLCEDGEFHTYVGATKAEVRTLMEVFLSALKRP